MTYTRRQVVTSLSVVYLIVAIAVAGYASSRAKGRSVPISKMLANFTTALPIIAGLLLEGAYDLTHFQARRNRSNPRKIERPPLVIIANTIIFIYSTAVITLLGTHAAPPSGLDCGLRDRWQTLFRRKDQDAIQKIQDAFNCCGLKNTRDMPFPFPDKSNGIDTCEKAFNRHSGCLGSWRAEEQQIAGIFMGVVAMVLIWQFAIIAIPTQRESWLHSVVPNRISRMIADERHDGNGEPRRAIDYIPGYNRYSDRVEEEEHRDDNPTSRRAIEEDNRRLDSALPGHQDQDQPATIENEWARA